MGREKITGVMPLYLFKEHWEIARRKAPPIYGFLCTLDIMGYASSQYFTVPFLVLLKALEKAKEDPTQRNIRIKDMILHTCKIMMLGNDEFRKNTLKQLSDFHNGPEFRTADIVPSIPLMLAQLFTFLSLENFAQYLSDDTITFTREHLQVIFRFAFEEQMRRAIKPDAEPLTKPQLLKLLMPDYRAFVDAVMEERLKEIKAEFKASGEAAGSEMDMYREQARLFREMDTKRGAEEKKQGAGQA